MGRVIMSGVAPLLTVPVPPSPPPCLTFSSPSTFSISVATPGWDGTMEYSTDKSTWATWDGSKIAAQSNDGTYALYIRGAGNTKVTGDSAVGWTLTGSGIACEGNIETLLDYTTVSRGKHPTMAKNCYAGMFAGCVPLVAAPELPATVLAPYCYSAMFKECSGLTDAPSLPATTLADACYNEMFYTCSSLTAAPALPATTLADGCYQYMFYGCYGLTSAPALPATTLADSCYCYMFNGCRNLASAPALPATTLAAYCYYGMFQGCGALMVSSTQTGGYTTAYRIPTSGTGTTANQALYNMFASTGGTFTGTPEINTTYYLDESGDGPVPEP